MDEFWCNHVLERFWHWPQSLVKSLAKYRGEHEKNCSAQLWFRRCPATSYEWSSTPCSGFGIWWATQQSICGALWWDLYLLAPACIRLKQATEWCKVWKGFADTVVVYLLSVDPSLQSHPPEIFILLWTDWFAAQDDITSTSQLLGPAEAGPYSAQILTDGSSKNHLFAALFVLMSTIDYRRSNIFEIHQDSKYACYVIIHDIFGSVLMSEPFRLQRMTRMTHRMTWRKQLSSFTNGSLRSLIKLPKTSWRLGKHTSELVNWFVWFVFTNFATALQLAKRMFGGWISGKMSICADPNIPSSISFQAMKKRVTEAHEKLKGIRQKPKWPSDLSVEMDLTGRAVISLS